MTRRMKKEQRQAMLLRLLRIADILAEVETDDKKHNLPLSRYPEENHPEKDVS